MLHMREGERVPRIMVKGAPILELRSWRASVQAGAGRRLWRGETFNCRVVTCLTVLGEEIYPTGGNLRYVHDN